MRNCGEHHDAKVRCLCMLAPPACTIALACVWPTHRYVVCCVSLFLRVHHFSSLSSIPKPNPIEDGLSVRTYTENFFSSHLDEAGEPWGATRGPQGRRGQPPDGSDGQGRAHSNLRGREGVNVPAALFFFRFQSSQFISLFQSRISQ